MFIIMYTEYTYWTFIMYCTRHFIYCVLINRSIHSLILIYVQSKCSGATFVCLSLFVYYCFLLACMVKCKKHLKINLSMLREAKWKIVHSVFLYQALWQTKNEKKYILEIRKKTMSCDLYNLSPYQPWEYSSLFIATQRLQMASSIATPSS